MKYYAIFNCVLDRPRMGNAPDKFGIPPGLHYLRPPYSGRILETLIQ